MGRLPDDVDAEVFDFVWMIGKAAPSFENKKTAEKRRSALVQSLPYRKAWEGVAGEFKFSPTGAPIRSYDVFRFDSDGLVSPAY